ncbi:MAG TPA: hypothetical protein VMR99_02075 [Candidatus Paceibacterota bacterium]|nr:hypothetical protein [Candidatus Paceibacterota bacterium]
MNKKKVIILQHNGGQLANQLWNFASVYAYCLEKGYECRNYSFFEYGYYFENITPDNFFIDVLFFKTFPIVKSIFSFKVARKIERIMYGLYVKLITALHGGAVIYYSDDSERPYYLPPTRASEEDLKMVETNAGATTIYFYGWLFRNPAGLEKYREGIVEYFKPRERYLSDARQQMKKLRNMYDRVIGVHIRKGDYQHWNGGAFFIGENRFRKIIDEYILRFSIIPEKTAFLFFSDGTIDVSEFNGLHVFLSNNHYDIGDLYELSLCDLIIGTDSTFGAFASWYGDIPFILATNSEIAWDYYNDKKTYFENKFSKMVHY